jgi:ABC-type multidrug transport system ATPase subunit
MAAVIEVEELRKRYGGLTAVDGVSKAALPDRLKVWEALDLYASFYDRPVAWPELLGTG